MYLLHIQHPFTIKHTDKAMQLQMCDQIFCVSYNYPGIIKTCNVANGITVADPGFQKGRFQHRYIARPYLIAAQQFFVIHAITSYLVYTCIY